MLCYGCLLFLIIIITALLLFYLNPRRRTIYAFNSVVTDFIVNYALFKDILHEDLDCEGIKKFLECDHDEDSENLKVFYLTFGVLRNMEFSNTKEMRQCFLKSGEYVLECEKILEVEFGCLCDPDGPYAVFLEILQKIRATCMARNEETIVSIQ